MGTASLAFPASIGFLPLFQILDDPVQLVEAIGPELAVLLEPCRRFLQSIRTELAGPHATGLPRDDEPGLLQYADVLLHAREGHVEFPGEIGDRGLSTSELLQYPASSDVRESGERGVEVGIRILNHRVQYTSKRTARK